MFSRNSLDADNQASLMLWRHEGRGRINRDVESAVWERQDENLHQTASVGKKNRDRVEELFRRCNWQGLLKQKKASRMTPSLSILVDS